MRIFYDCEFLEDGHTIDLISIGMVAEDGREFYAVNEDANWARVRRHPWLMANVVPNLPKAYGDARNHMPRRWLFNYDDPSVKPRSAIASEVEAFVHATPGPVELWADYGAYDHVVLAQLFGTMMQLPAGFPMWTHDLQQYAAGRDLLEQTGTVHNALEDARWLCDAHRALAA